MFASDTLPVRPVAATIAEQADGPPCSRHHSVYAAYWNSCMVLEAFSDNVKKECADH